MKSWSCKKSESIPSPRFRVRCLQGSILLLTVEKLIYGGDGLAHLPADAGGPGKTVFLPFVLAGENR